MTYSTTPRHFLSTGDFSRGELESFIDLACDFKSSALDERSLLGRSIVLVFFNPSLRTRTSMEIAAYELGGNAVTLDIGKGTWNLECREGVVMDADKSEHIKEAASVLSRYAAAIGVRAFPEMQDFESEMADPVLKSFAKYSTVPVLNLESSRYHPFQALADIMTIREQFGSGFHGKAVLSWANHPKPLPMAVPNSFALIAAQFGLDLTIACPPEYDLGDEVMDEVMRASKASGGQVTMSRDMREAARGAKVIYAKSWGGKQFYGRPEDDLKVRENYKSWRVDGDLMRSTDDAIFMHCLPVRRNVVVADEVLDGPSNAAIDEAENRLHVQKSVLASLIGQG